MIEIIPYLRNKISISLVLSAIALLTISSLPLPNPLLLLQPVQATTFPTSIQTQNPVKLGRSCSSAPDATLTFEAKGNGTTLTNGTFQITNGSSSGQTLWSGDLFRARSQEGILLVYGVHGNVPVCGIGSGHLLEIETDCGGYGNINLSTDGGNIGSVFGMVNCEFPSDTAAQPSPTMTGTTNTQDSDRDGIPDSSDRCTHNSNPRCFKEGDTTTQQQQSSSNRTGNQTR